MADIVEKLKDACVIDRHYGKSVTLTLDYDDYMEAADEIIRLRAEVERLTAERDRQYDQNAEQITRIAALESENEKLRAALRECEAELNAYYRMEYPSDHPYSQKKLAQAMASNPATVALKEKP